MTKSYLPKEAQKMLERIEALFSQLTPAEQEEWQTGMTTRGATCMKNWVFHNSATNKQGSQLRRCNNVRDPNCPGGCQERGVAQQMRILAQNPLPGETPVLSHTPDLYMMMIPLYKGKRWGADTRRWARHGILYRSFVLLASRRFVILTDKDPQFPELVPVTLPVIATLMYAILSNLVMSRRGKKITGSLKIKAPVMMVPEGKVGVWTKAISTDAPEEVSAQTYAEARKLQVRKAETLSEVESFSQAVMNDWIKRLTELGYTVIEGRTRLFVDSSLEDNGINDKVTWPSQLSQAMANSP